MAVVALLSAPSDAAAYRLQQQSSSFAAPGTGAAALKASTTVRTRARPEASRVGAGAGGFRDSQLQYPRVRTAEAAQSADLAALYRGKGLTREAEVFFRVFKHEQVLEVWARQPGDPRFSLLKAYPVCKLSGRLGPKSRQGDLQVPEGFYSIDLFNPWSNYHLSMRVDYPNAVDRARGRGARLGGDIYIHGGCATIGCVPVTDEAIQEIYLIAVNARDAGQRQIPVHIFPTRLDDAGMSWLREHYGANYVDYGFWQNLQAGYQAFERTRNVPLVSYAGSRYGVTPVSPPLGSPIPVATGRVSKAAEPLRPVSPSGG